MSKHNRPARNALLYGSAGAAALLLSSTSSAAEQDVIAEIVVTAQKRAENLQDVPTAVSVFNDEKLTELHATQLVDYASYMPGIYVASGGSPGQTTVTLRGVAPVGPGSVVGTYIDDTPLGSSANYARATAFALDLMPYDVQRVEVLRGPQGTLYGAGAMGGLLKYVLHEPDLTTFSFKAGLEGNSVKGADELGWGARAAINVPLGETVGLRASYFNQETPGYIDNLLTGEEDENLVNQDGGRAVFLWRPSDSFSLKLAGTWQRVESDDNAAMSLTLTGIDPPRGTTGFGDLKSLHNISQPFSKDVDYYSATLSWDFGWGSLISASSYSETRTHQTQDATETFGALLPLVGLAPGLSWFELGLDLDKWTQEFRLASASGRRIEWLVGVYYTEEDSKNVQHVFVADMDGVPIPAFQPFFIFAELPSKYEELAGFGNVTFKLTESFDVTAGLRWAQNDQKFRQISGGIILPTADDPGESSEDVLTWMISPRWHINEDTMAYARIATGYRPGGPNVVLPGVPPSVGADELTNYELGLKAQFLDHRALLNVAAFFIDWEDIQQTRPFTAGVTALDNVGTAESKGLELESAFLVGQGWRLGLNLAYTNAELKSTPPEIDNTLGVQLPNVPEWSGAFTIDYDFMLGSYDAHVGAGFRHVGARNSSVVTDTNNLSVRLPSYEVVDLSADVKFDRLTLRLFAKNLTDERAYSSAAAVTDPLSVPVRIDVAVVQPRTLGVSMDFEF